MVSPWITGALGWAFFGPLGGLFGYAAGSLFNAAQRGNAPGGGAPQAGPEAARNGFIASLLALTAAMMKADGRATKSELEVVKAFFTQQFGKETAQEALRLLRDLLERDIPLGPICAQIQRNMNYSQRMALLHFLFSIAHADGELHPAEDRLLARLASDLGLYAADVRSIAAMFAPRAPEAPVFHGVEKLWPIFPCRGKLFSTAWKTPAAARAAPGRTGNAGSARAERG